MTEPTDEEQAAAAAAALRRVSRSTRRVPTRNAAPATYSADRDPQALGSSIDRLVRDQGWEDRSAVATLVSDWASIVGVDLANHVSPAGFEEGVLTLQADSTAWATQLRLLLPSVHATIDERLGAGVVQRLRILGPAAPSWSSGSRRVPGRGPRDTYG